MLDTTWYAMTLLFVLLGGFLVPGVPHVSGIMIYTAAEVEAVNGTDVKLKCIFSSRYPVSSSTLVTWSFQPQHGGREETAFFYMRNKPYPPIGGRFKGHAVWSGDLMQKDASIALQQVSPSHNGTYTCTVKNGPDVHRHGRDGEVVLRVVNQKRFDTFDWLLTLFDWTGARV